MTGFIITVHVIACVSLIVIVLVQRGKGGGLVESFSGLENMMGGKSSDFLKRATTVFSIIFFFTCVTLTFLSVKKSKSLLKNISDKQPTVESKAPAVAEPVAAPLEKAQKENAVALPQEAPAAAAKEDKVAAPVEKNQNEEKQK